MSSQKVKLEVITAVSRLFWIVTFYCPLLMAFDIYHTAVNIDGDGFELALSQELSEEFEIDFPQHLGRFVTEVSQEPGYRFRFFDRNSKLVDQGIALQQFQPFQFVIPMKLPQSMVLMWFILILLVDAFSKTRS